jgi:hypothetical protein
LVFGCAGRGGIFVSTFPQSSWGSINHGAKSCQGRLERLGKCS